MANSKKRVGENAAGDFFVDSTCIESMKRLTQYQFECVFPGHGQRVHLAESEMQRQLVLVERMQLT